MDAVAAHRRRSKAMIRRLSRRGHVVSTQRVSMFGKPMAPIVFREPRPVKRAIERAAMKLTPLQGIFLGIVLGVICWSALIWLFRP
jgi:hypothetical protein